MQKPLVIGTIFSSDSSDDDTPRRPARTSASESERPRHVSLQVSVTSGEEKNGSTLRVTHSERVPTTGTIATPNQQPPEGYTQIEKNRIGSIKHNTMIQYETVAGKLVRPKYFKKCDQIADSIVVGFFSHNKRNYSEGLSKIKCIYVYEGIQGGMDALKDTIEIQKDDWKTLPRDMVISYEKENHEFVYRVKFNALLKGPDGSSRMSLTSEKGFNYTANPAKIIKIFRHVTSNDRTLTFILEALRKLEARIRVLERPRKPTNVHQK